MTGGLEQHLVKDGDTQNSDGTLLTNIYFPWELQSPLCWAASVLLEMLCWEP